MAPKKQKPFQLLEINIISAQDLEPVSRKMKTYATAWVNPNRKLTSRMDSDGHNNPTWNDKFVFRVGEDFLRLDTSAVMIEIHSRSWFKETLVGTVRLLVGNLFPPHTRPQSQHHNLHLGMRFVAVQVRRQSGRPQGILNIGVALLDSSMRSMPLYNNIAASAVGYRDLTGEEDQHENNNRTINQPPVVKPILVRSRSERSGLKFDNMSMTGSSMVGVPQKSFAGKASSMVSGSELGEPIRIKGIKGKASSMVSGSEFSDPIRIKGVKGKASSVINGTELRDPKRGKASSLVSDSVASSHRTGLSTSINRIFAKKTAGSVVNGSQVGEKPTKSSLGLPPRSSVGGNGRLTFAPPPRPYSTYADSEVGPTRSSLGGNGRLTFAPPPKPYSTYGESEVGGPRSSVGGNGRLTFAPPPKPYSTYTDSEVGPSPSEVAAAMVERRYPLEDEWSSVLDGWSLDESVEGLRSKLDRWRTELPPLYDRRGSSSFGSSTTQNTQKQNPDNKNGLFSCLSNIYGIECQCVCGKPKPQQRKRSRSRSPSVVSSKGGSTFL